MRGRKKNGSYVKEETERSERKRKRRAEEDKREGRDRKRRGESEGEERRRKVGRSERWREGGKGEQKREWEEEEEDRTDAACRSEIGMREDGSKRCWQGGSLREEMQRGNILGAERTGLRVRVK